MTHCLAYFVTPHGFGHAARACGVMDSLYALDSTVRFVIFSTVPKWFFTSSLRAPFDYVELETDIGLVQNGPLHENIPSTVERLNAFFPPEKRIIRETIKLIERYSCGLIINDISPLGIVIGKEMGITTLLIENFTWDWIYDGYGEAGFIRHIHYLEEIYAAVDYHLLAEPFCCKSEADMICSPISRKSRTKGQEIRNRLELKEGERCVLLTMGGIREEFGNVSQLKDLPNIVFVIPGSRDRFIREDGIIYLPFQSDFFHPDLIEASDVVVGKVGYSTLAEVYQSGKPFGYIPRSGFRESDILEAFIKDRMQGLAISEKDFYNGRWLERLDSLLKLPTMRRKGSTGAEEAAGFIRNLLL